MAVPDRQPTSTDKDTIAFVESLYEEARVEKKKIIEPWRLHYNLLRNRGWSASRPAHLPSARSSELFPTFHTLISYCTDQFPQFFVSPSPETRFFQQPPEPSISTELAQDMQTVLTSWWTTQAAQPQLEMALWDAFTYGAGILTTGWDPAAKGGEGDVFLRRVDPWYCLNDPNAAGFEDSRYFIEVAEVPLYEIRYRFPERGHLVQPEGRRTNIDRKPDATGSTMDLLPQIGDVAGEKTTWGYPGHASSDYTEVVTLKTCWVRGVHQETFPVIEGGKRVDDIDIEVPYWERICTANGVVLTEETANPFDHNGLPYVRLPMVEIGEFWSTSLAEHLRPACIALNHLLVAAQMHAEITGNPILLEPEMSGISRGDIINRPGGRLTTNIAATNLIRWLDPPRMGPEVSSLIAFWRETIDRASGISAVARGTTLRRREAAATVDAVQESSFVRIRAVLRNEEEALRQLGNQIASGIVQFYTEPRAVPIIGPKGSESTKELNGRHFWLPQIDARTGEQLPDEPMRFDVSVLAGSTLPISRQARMAETMQFFQMGIVDDEAVLEAAEYPGREKIVARNKEKQALMQQMAAQQEEL